MAKKKNIVIPVAGSKKMPMVLSDMPDHVILSLLRGQSVEVMVNDQQVQIVPQSQAIYIPAMVEEFIDEVLKEKEMGVSLRSLVTEAMKRFVASKSAKVEANPKGDDEASPILAK